MSDELNVWREAVMTQFGCASDKKPDAAAAVIRDYGDKRDATARSEGHAAGYQQAIADVVEWLRARAADDIASSAYCRRGNAGKTLTRFARRRIDDANEITRRFGKGQDHG